MGSGKSKARKDGFFELTQRRLSRDAYVMVGCPNLVLTDFRGVERKEVMKLNSFCIKCHNYYDTNSIWFHIRNEQSSCFSCYTRHRIPFMLLHRFLCKEALLGFLPVELLGLLKVWAVQKDQLLVKTHDSGWASIIPQVTYLVPHLQYNLVIHAEREFVLMPVITYQFTSRNGEKARIRVTHKNEAFYVYYSGVGSREFTLDTKTTDCFEMLQALDHQIESCLFCYQYSRFYKPPQQPKPETPKMVGIAFR